MHRLLYFNQARRDREGEGVRGGYPLLLWKIWSQLSLILGENIFKFTPSLGENIFKFTPILGENLTQIFLTLGENLFQSFSDFERKSTSKFL
jgi:hypothetical protein